MFVLPVLCSLLECQAARLGSGVVCIKGLEGAGCQTDTPFLSLVKSQHSRCPEGGRERREVLGEAARGKEPFLDPSEGKRNQHVSKERGVCTKETP